MIDKLKIRGGQFEIQSSLAKKYGSEIFSQLKFAAARFYSRDFDRVYQYLGSSPMFEEMRVNEEIPYYDIDVTEKEDGSINVEAKRIQ